jgi:ABC-2 type transport system permease protein
MVGGGTVPLVFMPAFLRMASNASPFTWALLATEGATWRSWSVAEFAMPLTVLAVIGGACMSTGVLAIRRAAP